ncbi:MAG TPA: LysM peptidoglycan-binding domain-containing protein [Chitinophagaceae bacterium]|jgi:nucleoid-associated protein YgaU|nr:LysM peptidoglycan-binding domain-containing protein [Chitinophagaceae bacterium]
MALKDKYSEVVNAANAAGVTNLQVREQGNVLYIDGVAPSEDVKQKLWDIYGRIDPDYRAADMVMNITVARSNGGTKEYTVVKGDSLSKIGKQLGVRWKDIYEANKDRIKDPDHIEPGWKLKIPG